MPNLFDIGRNDLPAAKAYYEANGERITPDEWHVLCRLQDDADEFKRMARSWNVESAGRFVRPPSQKS